MKSLPRLNAGYWVLMLICTTMGELIGNLISRNFELGYTQGALLDIAIFSVTIALFLALRLKNECFYWILIIMGNIGGTNLADWVTLEPLKSDRRWALLKPLQLGTQTGSLAVMICLIIILFVRTLTARAFPRWTTAVLVCYWFAILLSSTFGTTSGDLITNDTPLGALGGSMALVTALAVVYAGYRIRLISSALAYWAALVLVHPIGATFGNWVSKPIGLNLGNVYTNVVLITFFLVIYVVDGRAHVSTRAYV